jgi:hypothetical protein
VKDRLIQTRVPERLESVLKEEAQKRRLTVSHLIRNMLEDTLQLVDTVVAGAGEIVDGSVDLAEQVKRDAGKLATTARMAVQPRGKRVEPAPEHAGPAERGAKTGRAAWEDQDEGEVRAARLAALDHVLAWNEVVVNRSAECAGCDRELPRGGKAHLGMSQDPTAAPAWLCADCLDEL